MSPLTNPPPCMLLVLRAEDGKSLAELAPFAMPGAHVAIGRGVAVVVRAFACQSGPETLTLSDIQDLMPSIRDAVASVSAQDPEALRGAPSPESETVVVSRAWLQQLRMEYRYWASLCEQLMIQEQARCYGATVAPETQEQHDKHLADLRRRAEKAEQDVRALTGETEPLAPEPLQSEASAPLAQDADDPTPLLSMLSSLEAEAAALPPGMFAPDLERRMAKLQSDLQVLTERRRAGQHQGRSDVSSSPCNWPDLVVRDFLHVALRHVEVKGSLRYQDVRDAIDYLVEQHGAHDPLGAALRDDYQLMPLEPTVDMLVAGQEEWARGRKGALEDCKEAQDIWRAMAAAAPAMQLPRSAGAGADLLLVLEKIAREIQREAVCGGIIARAIAEGRS